MFVVSVVKTKNKLRWFIIWTIQTLSNTKPTNIKIFAERMKNGSPLCKLKCTKRQVLNLPRD